MIDRREVEAAVHGAFATYNESQPEALRIDPSAAVVLVGPDGRLDSMGLVHLVVALEEQLADRFGVQLTLADERAFSQKRSPFRDLPSLLDFVESRLREAAAS